MVEAVVSFAVERLHDLLTEEARLLIGVSDKVKRMQNELKRMQCFLRDAERKQDKNDTIKNYISEVRKLAYDAEDVIEIYAIKVALGISIGTKNPLTKTKHLHKVGTELTSINSRIDDLTRSLQNYGFIATEDNEEVSEVQRQLRWSYSHIVEEFIVGLDKDIDKVVEWLLNENHHCQFVYICGMGGLGKTTLAKSIYHYNAIRRNFDGFAWAYISQKCKKRDVWEGILLKLISPTKEERDEIKNMTDDELARKLFKVQQDKKCLIILDDIWSNEAWDMLSPAFPSRNTRSKIVFTSRNKDISLHVDPEGLLHEPSCLNPEDSWALFKKKAFPRQDNPESTVSDEFIRLGREMVAKCAGLPLTIIVLGGLLATKERVSDWATIGGEVREKRKVEEVLDLSYQDLPCQLKPCFLYLSQFPEDSEIPRTKLIQLWVAEGVVSSQYETERDETMEDVAERYLGNLISRCMVQVGQMGSTGRIKTCRLHDLMRDLCLSKARKENFLYIINGSQQNSTIDVASSSNLSDARRIDEVRRLAVFLDQRVDQLIPQDKQVNEHLRSLVFFHDKKCRMENWDLVKGVFVEFKLLRVLDLEGIKGLKGQSLPKEVGNLLWLKFLSLKRTRIQILPSSLGNLENLQFLNLQTVNKVSWDSTVEIPNVILDVEKLVLGCPFLRKLQVEGRMERLPAASLFPPQLSKLTLWGCRLVEDPMVTLEKLPNLKFLNGWDMFVGKKMACSPNGFPQLKVLVLRGLPNLHQWTIEDQAMPNLYRLSISDCNNLKTVPDGLKFITTLRELEIRWMPKSFKTRLGTAGEDYHKVQHVPSIISVIEAISSPLVLPEAKVPCKPLTSRSISHPFGGPLCSLLRIFKFGKNFEFLRIPLPGGSSLCEGMGEGCCTQPYPCICKEAVSGFEPMTNKSPRHNFTAAPGLALR
ncbi:putative disease resistance protein [Glycine soja]